MSDVPRRVWGDMRKGNAWPLTQSEAVRRVWDQEGHPYVEYILAEEYERIREAIRLARVQLAEGNDTEADTILWKTTRA